MLQPSPKDPSVCYRLLAQKITVKSIHSCYQIVCERILFSSADRLQLAAPSSENAATYSSARLVHANSADRKLPQVDGGRALRACHVVSAEDV